MPKYKRKKVRKVFKQKHAKNNQNNDIIMSNSKSKKQNIVPESDIKVVRGAKLKRKRRITAMLTAVAVICAFCIFMSLILPVSLAENIVNTVSVMGAGSYPSNISGSTVLDTVSNGSYYYVLSDTNITAFNNSGKKIFSEMHGFANPIMSVSSTRAIVYDQGGNNLYVYNLSGQINSLQTENKIISANISRSGNFAVATHSDSYTSSVFVYDKNCEQIYVWNSAKNIVNNVLLNSSGKQLAVSTLNAVSGQYDSNVLILDFESPDPLYTLKLDTSVALSLINSGKGISVITADKYKFIHWSKFTVSDITASGEINVCRRGKNGTLLVFNRANDRSDNTVVLVSNKGEKISEFKLNGIITDIAFTNNRVYYISENKVSITDKNGVVLRDAPCDYGAVRFSVTGSNSLALISDKQVSKINIEKEE